MPSPEDQARLDAFFAEADDILENWQPGGDAAEWCADGSHELDHIEGDYYASDIYSRRRRDRAPHLHPEMRRDGGRGIRGQRPSVMWIDEIDEMRPPTAAELAAGIPLHVASTTLWSDPNHDVVGDIRRAQESLRQMGEAADAATWTIQRFVYAEHAEVACSAERISYGAPPT